MNSGFTIVGLGEALWDVLPGGQILGGAPLNVACHVHSLLRSHGAGAIVASRVGTDSSGDAVVRELERRGMTATFVQRDAKHPTSTVSVTLAAGQPTYAFANEIAWDHLEFTPRWAELAESCDAVCFGTLAQRSPQSRRAIWEFLDAAPQALRLFDVNLRQSFYDRECIVESCRRATLVKLNDQELDAIAQMLNLPAGTHVDRLQRMSDKLGPEAVVFTRGARGTLLVHRNGVEDPQPVTYPAAANADTVGAGDACSAGILAGRLLKWPPARTAALANRLGAFVASQPGATPELPAELVAMVSET
jgi:fructokinase